MLDASGSVGADNFEVMKNFVSNVAGQATVSQAGTHVGVIVFSSSAAVIFYLNAHQTTSAVQSAVMSIQYTQGGTNFDSALSLALTDMFTAAHGARLGNDVSKVAILLTDGQDSSTAAVTTAQRMRAAGIRVMALGIGTGVSYANLLPIVNTTDNYFSAANFTQLSDTLANTILNQTCTADVPGVKEDV